MIHRITILFLSLCAIAFAQPSLTNNNLDNLTPTAKDNLEALGVLTDDAGPDNAAVASAIAEDPPASREAIGIMLGSGAPDNGNGADGSYYIDEDSGALYKKASGTWAVSAAPSSQEVFFVTALPSSGTGNNGDLAVVYTDGTISGLAEKSGGTWALVANNVPSVPKPTDSGVISLVDHFLGGNASATTTGMVGEMNWEVQSTIGTGFCRPVADATATGRLGVLRIATGNVSGNVQTIQFSNGVDSSNSFKVDAFYGLTNLLLRFEFKANTTGDFYLGLSSNPNASAAAPTRFVGIKALEGTTNFQFEVTNGTPVTVDTGVAVDTDWHTFELTYDSDNSEWGMSIDGGASSALALTLSPALTVTISAWVKTNAAAIESLYLDTFQLYGIK